MLSRRPSIVLLLAVLLAALVAGCSSTSSLADDEQLYAGLKKIEYSNYEPCDHFSTARAEVEGALSARPNGALFGSSYYRSPIPIRLWIYNATINTKNPFAKWFGNAFGTPPVLISEVNPALRASVAQSTLASNGYFRGTVGYNIVPLDKKKQSKIAYTVDMGHLFTLDSISFARFPAPMDSLMRTTAAETLLKKDAPFSVSTLDQERQRLSSLFRNNGYYFYRPGYAHYLADTLKVPGKVQLKLQLVDSLDAIVCRKWYIGKTDLVLRKNSSRSTRDSLTRRSLTIHFSGKRPPVRTRVVLKDIKLRRGQPFSEDALRQSVSKLTSNETFSSIDFAFTPRDTTATCDTLDMKVTCVLDKPWDASLEGNVTGKTSSRVGPGVKVSLARRNAFRGGEKVSLNAYGSYEWQTGGSGTDSKVGINSYEYGIDLTLEMPRLLLPFWQKRRWKNTPQTLIKAANKVINRGKYFNRHIMSGEITYSFQPAETRKHIFSPLILEYDYMNRVSDEFLELIEKNPYLYVSMQNQFIPKMRYTFIYTSPSNYRNPITWETTVSESANLISLGYLAAGRKWNEKDKNMFKNPYAQFVKLETDFTKQWSVGKRSSVVAHVSAGVIYSYGNSEASPYSEQFYVGGANSIRAFTVRRIGPGQFHTEQAGLSYLAQTGDIKFVANIEYRPQLFGNLFGAVFLDAGNVWAMRDDGIRGEQSVFRPKNLLRDLALGTGIGLRYDLDFFVIRLDWGIGLHLPFDTGRSGYFNIGRFKDATSVHLAIGYPF